MRAVDIVCIGYSYKGDESEMADKFYETMSTNCRIYLDGECISDEPIIKAYIDFLSNNLKEEKHILKIGLHTGSECFDAVTTVVALLKCLSFNFHDNESLLEELKIGSMVMYKGGRYIWQGIAEENGQKRIYLLQHAVGRNGETRTSLLYEKAKTLISPYYGTSRTTDGRGIRRKKYDRNKFYSRFYGLPVEVIPNESEVSLIVVSDRNRFIDLCKRISLASDTSEVIPFLELAPIAYFTEAGTVVPLNSNPGKIEPVIKVTAKVSTARNLVMDKDGSKPVGFLVYDMQNNISNTELEGLLKRRKLEFSYGTGMLSVPFAEYVLTNFEQAGIFPCTKELLGSYKSEIENLETPVIRAFNLKNKDILKRHVVSTNFNGLMDMYEYKNFLSCINDIKDSSWPEEDKNFFVRTAYALLQFITTCTISLADFRKAQKEGFGGFDPLVYIENLETIAAKAYNMQKQSGYIIGLIKTCCNRIIETNIKNWFPIVINYKYNNVAIITKKESMAQVLRELYERIYPMVDFVSCAKFNKNKHYSCVIVVGDIYHNKLDPLDIYNTDKLWYLLYDWELNRLAYRQKKRQSIFAKLNKQAGLRVSNSLLNTNVVKNEDSTMAANAEIEQYLQSISIVDINRYIDVQGKIIGSTRPAVVKAYGIFDDGSKILFSPYFHALVYDQEKHKVSEKAIDKLEIGDQLIFSNNDSYTRNLVDILFDKLLSENKLPEGTKESFDWSKYWKKALLNYKDINQLKYKDLANRFKIYGASINEVTIRSWLLPDSHIVGPRKEETLMTLGKVINDAFLINNTAKVFQACRNVRSVRIKILDLIGKALAESFAKDNSKSDTLVSYIAQYGTKNNLSKCLALVEYQELSEEKYVNPSVVNHPLDDLEVEL